MHGIELVGDRFGGPQHEGPVELARSRGLEAQQRLAQRAGARVDALAALAPELRDSLQHLAEGGAAVARFGREVGPAPEGLAFGCEEHGERPAALLAEQCERLLVDGVDVRPFLAVDLDGDEMLADQPPDLRVLEALVRHHVAPVAGGVTDREQDRHVPPPRLREGLGTPFVPGDGIVGVLQQIGARGPGEPVRHGRLPALVGRGRPLPAHHSSYAGRRAGPCPAARGGT